MVRRTSTSSCRSWNALWSTAIRGTTPSLKFTRASSPRTRMRSTPSSAPRRNAAAAQALYLDRRRSKAVAQLGADRVDCSSRSSLKCADRGAASATARGRRRREERPPSIETSGGAKRLGPLLLLLHAPDRFLEAGCSIEAHGVGKAGLFGTEQVAAPQLEILERDRVAAAELRVVLQDAQPLLRVLGDVPVRNEVAVRPVVRPSHAAAGW